MDRNMRYVNSGPRSLPHMSSSSSKRHSAGARLSPPAQPTPGNVSPHNNGHGTHNHHEDLIQYIYESWSKVTRDLERGGDEAKYYQEVATPRQLANFRPFNLEELWGRRMLQNINRNKHRS